MRHTYAQASRLTPVVALTSVLAIALFLMLATTPVGTPLAAAADHPAPSYAGLQPMLERGEGKQIDQGTFDIYCNQQSVPSGWLFAVDDTRDGNGEEYWVLHTTFLHPGPTHDGVALRFDYLPAVQPPDIGAFVSWIVSTYPHVSSADELVIHHSTVQLID